MHITVEAKWKNDIVHVYHYKELSTQELELVSKFGDPSVEHGGSFGDFTLDPNPKTLKGNNPVIQTFDAADYGRTGAQNHANTYITVMKQRLTEAIQALKDITDTVTVIDKTTV